MSTYATGGFVPVHVPQPGPTIADFLDAIDPQELEQAALEHVGGFGGPSTGEAFLLALKKMAEDFCDGA